VAYSSPNMFGDFFGTTNPYRLTFQLPPTQVTTVIPPPPPSTSMPPGPAQTIITTIPGRIVTLDVPLAGSIVERTKIGEDNNPLPRDRVFFTYDYFNSVPLNGEVGVHNFVLGFEKTFCDQMASIEVRVPADAQIWIDGVKTKQHGAKRAFASPTLAAGKDYVYEIRAVWREDGRETTETRKITFRAGAQVSVDFTKPAGKPETLAMPKTAK